MGLSRWSKDTQRKLSELSDSLDRDYGLMILPITIIILLAGIPLIFIEMIAPAEKIENECFHVLDTKKPGYRKNPTCVKCGKEMCQSRNNKGGNCMLLRGHEGRHRNPFLKESSEWLPFGDTRLGDGA